MALAVLLLLVASAPALAADADLKQTVTDLSAQTDDKERLDTAGAVKVEISQLRTWLNEATNAIKEDKEKICRELFERSRAQLKLVDQLAALAQLENEAKKLEDAVSSARKGMQAARRKLEDKQVQLRALSITNK
jgi:hypothetical protein